VKLADTCVWIEALAGTPTGERYYPMLQDPEKLVVPTLVQYELRRWCLRVLRSGQSEAVADKAIAATRAAQVVVLDEATALYAAELAQTYGLATADALVYATALRQRALLVTCDANFEGLAGVDYQPKLVH
jgi:predicted nucleic acid-binding protein